MEIKSIRIRSFRSVFLAALIVGFPVASFSDTVNWIEALKKMYISYPSSRVLADSSRLALTMKRVDPAAAEQIQAFIKDHPTEFDALRSSALRLAGRTPYTKGTVYVVGLSGGGATAAKILSEAGYHVEAYESRANPTREIQLGSRQSFLDAITMYYGPEMGHQFCNGGICRPIGPAYKHVDPSLHVANYPLPEKRDPSPGMATDKLTGHAIVTTSSVGAVAVKEVEAALREELSKDPNVTLHLGEKAPEMVVRADGTATIVGDITQPKLILVAEGAGAGSKPAPGRPASVSTSLGFERVPASPERLQVAGVIYTDIPGGNAVGSEIRLPGSDFTIVSGSLHRSGSGKVWFVTDLDPKAIEPSSAFSPGTPPYQQEKARLVESHYRQIASTVLKISPEAMKGMRITGATGADLQPFKIQQGLTTHAVKGNVVQLGDAVGNGHWAVGAGAMISMTAHADALAGYLNDLERGVPASEAGGVLDARLRADSMAWIRAGIPKFWPDLEPELVTQAYDTALHEYEAGRATSIQVALEREVAKIPPKTAAHVPAGTTASAGHTDSAPDSHPSSQRGGSVSCLSSVSKNLGMK